MHLWVCVCVWHRVKHLHIQLLICAGVTQGFTTQLKPNFLFLHLLPPQFQLLSHLETKYSLAIKALSLLKQETL